MFLASSVVYVAIRTCPYNGFFPGRAAAGGLVARLGGDEFAVLVCGPDAQQHTQEIANRLLAELAKPVIYGAERLTVTTSIGVALYPLHGRDIKALLLLADNAMYQAKSAGGNRVQLNQQIAPARVTNQAS